MNKPQIALTREQMRELQSLGLDCSDASLCWCQEPNEDEYKLFLHDEFCYEAACLNPVPAYTLEDILCKLPTFLVSDSLGYILILRTGMIGYWNIDKRCELHREDFGRIIDGAFRLLKWVMQKYPDKIIRLER